MTTEDRQTDRDWLSCFLWHPIRNRIKPSLCIQEPARGLLCNLA